MQSFWPLQLEAMQKDTGGLTRALAAKEQYIMVSKNSSTSCPDKRNSSTCTLVWSMCGYLGCHLASRASDPLLMIIRALDELCCGAGPARGAGGGEACPFGRRQVPGAAAQGSGSGAVALEACAAALRDVMLNRGKL